MPGLGVSDDLHECGVVCTVLGQPRVPGRGHEHLLVAKMPDCIFLELSKQCTQAIRFRSAANDLSQTVDDRKQRPVLLIDVIHTDAELIPPFGKSRLACKPALGFRRRRKW